METTPDAWVFVIRGGLPIEMARLLLSELCASGRWHIESLEESKYLVLVETMEAAGSLREALSRISADHQIASFQKLKRLRSTGDPSADQAIMRSIRALYGELATS